MKRLAAVLAVMLFSALAGPVAVAETQLSDPKPSFENPRKIMLQLTTDDPRQINSILWNAINLQKFYGIDNVQIAIIAFGTGMKALYAKDSPVVERVTSQLKYGIEYVACANTMETTHRNAGELIPGVTVVTAGIAEIAERQLRGWIYVSP